MKFGVRKPTWICKGMTIGILIQNVVVYGRNLSGCQAFVLGFSPPDLSGDGVNFAVSASVR